MRRAFVILLVLLFPFHVFAELVEYPLPQHMEKAEHFDSDAVTSSNAALMAIIGVAANYDHDSDEPPASADLHDSLLVIERVKSPNGLTYPTPAYRPWRECLLVLPLIKPPPRV